MRILKRRRPVPTVVAERHLSDPIPAFARFVRNGHEPIGRIVKGHVSISPGQGDTIPVRFVPNNGEPTHVWTTNGPGRYQVEICEYGSGDVIFRVGPMAEQFVTDGTYTVTW